MLNSAEVFISYSSHDADSVERLDKALAARGVRLWRDSGSIRPGDRFPESLGLALRQCQTVLVVVSSNSIASDWVRWEVERVQSERPDTRIIPVRLDDARLPFSLDERHVVDLQDPARFEGQVDKIVWSGIRGTPLRCLVLHGVGAMPWPHLKQWLDVSGVPITVADYVEFGLTTATNLIEQGFQPICIVDPFEDWPFQDFRFRPPQCYADEIFKIRAATKGTKHEIPFILYSHPDALTQAEHGFSNATFDRLSHYYSIPKLFPDRTRAQHSNTNDLVALSAATQLSWTKAQRLVSNNIFQVVERRL